MTEHASSGAPEVKSKLRAQALNARAAAASGAGDVADDFLRHGLAFVSQPAGQTIAAYYPIRDEIDIRPLLSALHERGATIALPVTKPGPALIFREWVPGSPLVAAKFGLFEPPDSQPQVTPGLVFVPLLAFDRRGNRLGFGAGYYDSGLRALRAKARIIAVGVAFDAQEVVDIPHEPHDERLDYVLTPSGLIAFGD